MGTLRASFRAFALFSLSALIGFGQAPQLQPQPNTQSYGFDALNLFKQYDRASYKATTGQAAPACDPNRQIKGWFDLTVDQSDPSNLVIYKQLFQGLGTPPVLKQYVLSAGEAASVNLPGRESFPIWAPKGNANIQQIFVGIATGASPNPANLSTPDQAEQLRVAVGGTQVVEEAMQGTTWQYPAGEARRMFDVVFKGTATNVGQLLAAEYANGVGAPGHWDLSADRPVWVADAPASDCSGVTAVRAIPARDLMPNEKFAPTGLAGYSIVRTDLQAAAQQGQDIFTTADRAVLNQLLVLLQALSKK